MESELSHLSLKDDWTISLTSNSWSGSMAMRLLSEENMIFSTATLERAAKDGTIDSNEWENVHSTIIARLQRSIHNDFPLPRPPLTPPATPSPEITSSPPKRQGLDLPSPNTPILPSQKENEPSSSPPPPPLQPEKSPVNATPPTSAAQSITPEHATSVSITDSSDTDYRLPPDLQEIWGNVKDTLIESFSTHPPYTIQRLAELILEPRRHHKYLPAYLNALVRVVSVSSSTKVFPLPPVEPTPGGDALVNGDVTSSTIDKLQTDDSMGGALLTPIPWLQNGARSTRGSQGDLISTTSPNVASEDPDVLMTPKEALLEARPMTQGELIRREQELSDPPAPTIGSAPNLGAPIATQASHTSAREIMEDGTTVNAESPEPEGELPHARGPDQIGMEDTGPQEQGSGSPIGLIDLDAAVGRGSQKPREPPEWFDATISGLEEVLGEIPDDEPERSEDEHEISDSERDRNSSRPIEMTPSKPVETEYLEERHALAAKVGITDVDGMTHDDMKQASGRADSSGADSSISPAVKKNDSES